MAGQYQGSDGAGGEDMEEGGEQGAEVESGADGSVDP